jgi:cbb3-type cytochrome oxidase subunit 3
MHAILQFIREYGLFIGLPLLFLVVVAWIFRPEAKRRYEEDGKLPFRDGQP